MLRVQEISIRRQVTEELMECQQQLAECQQELKKARKTMNDHCAALNAISDSCRQSRKIAYAMLEVNLYLFDIPCLHLISDKLILRPGLPVVIYVLKDY